MVWDTNKLSCFGDIRYHYLRGSFDLSPPRRRHNHSYRLQQVHMTGQGGTSERKQGNGLD